MAPRDTPPAHATVSPLPSSGDPFLAAALALARQDRGFSPVEHDAFHRWLSESPEHAAATRSLEQVWRQLDHLHVLCPKTGDAPDPDLLGRRGMHRPPAA